MNIWIAYKIRDGKPVEERAYATRGAADRWCNSNGRGFWFTRPIPVSNGDSLSDLLSAAAEFAIEQIP